jgi:quinol monooxygenase YgiN
MQISYHRGEAPKPSTRQPAPMARPSKVMKRIEPSAAKPGWAPHPAQLPSSAGSTAAPGRPLANDIIDKVGTRVRLIFQLVLAIAVFAATLTEPAHAQGSAVYLATYVDVLPNAAVSGAALLKRYRDASRKEAGNLRFDVLQEIARPDRFAILEVWKDKAALDDHDKATTKLHFRDSLKAIQSAPYDERVGSGIYVMSTKSESRTGIIYVLTHVDVMPAYKDDCLELLKAMSIDTAKDHGNIGYEVLQQDKRPNHFTVVEEWTNRKGLDAHAMAAHTRSFRERLSPMAGALYDERFYKELG